VDASVSAGPLRLAAGPRRLLTFLLLAFAITLADAVAVGDTIPRRMTTALLIQHTKFFAIVLVMPLHMAELAPKLWAALLAVPRPSAVTAHNTIASFAVPLIFPCAITVTVTVTVTVTPLSVSAVPLIASFPAAIPVMVVVTRVIGVLSTVVADAGKHIPVAHS